MRLLRKAHDAPSVAASGQPCDGRPEPAYRTLAHEPEQHHVKCDEVRVVPSLVVRVGPGLFEGEVDEPREDAPQVFRGVWCFGGGEDVLRTNEGVSGENGDEDGQRDLELMRHAPGGPSGARAPGRRELAFSQRERRCHQLGFLA